MRGLGYYAGAVLATMKRDAVIFFSYRFRIVGQILAMFLTLTIFYYIGKLVRPDAVGPRGQYFAFVVVGIVTAGVLTSALSTSQIVRMELVADNFERVLISPLGPVWGSHLRRRVPDLLLDGVLRRDARPRRARVRCPDPRRRHRAGDGRRGARRVVPGLHRAAVRGRRTGVQVHAGGDLGDRRPHPSRRRLLPAEAVPGMDPMDLRCPAFHAHRRPASASTDRDEHPPVRSGSSS